MSFFRNLFESKPAQTDQEYTISLIDQLLDGKASPYIISDLKEFSKQYPDEISSRGIPELVKALSTFSEDDEVIRDLISIFAELLRSDNDKKEENAKIFLQCDDTIPNFVRNLDNKTPQIRAGAMHVLMMIANHQPSLFTESLTSHQPQMIRLFGSISDQNDQISSKFVSTLPKLVENNADFQQIVGFYAFESLVNSVSRDRPEFLEALLAILKDNQINQSLFVNSGFLKTIEKFLRTPDEKILDLMLLIFDPFKNSDKLISFRKNLEPTNVVNIICDNIIRNVYRPLNVHLLSICVKGNSDLTDRTKEKVPDFVRLALETRKSATVTNGNNSFLDGVDLFGEFFESFVFESEENAHFLNLTIINSQNIGFDSLTENFLNLCTFSSLIAPNCKSDFEEIFNSLISNIKRYETFPSMFKFFVCFCWLSKEYCDKISDDDKLTILIQLLVNDKNNSNAYFIPNSDSNSNEKRNHYLLLLFAEIILFSRKNGAKIGSVVSTKVLPYELENSINQLEISDNSKLGQFEKQIVQYINDNHLHESLKQTDDLIDDNDFYRNECERLQKENNELKNKLIENDENLNSMKNENDEKIKSLQSQISNIIINKDIQFNDDYEIKLQELQELNDQLTQENQAIKQQNSEFLMNIVNLKKQNADPDFEDLKKQMEEKIENLTSEISELRSQIEDKNTELQNEESSKLQLQGTIDDLSQKLKESNNNNESLQEQNRISSNELNQLKSSLEDAKTVSEDFQKQIHEKEDSISSLQSQNEQLKNKIEKKSIETTELIEKFNKEISELRSQQNLAGGDLISSLNNQIEKLKNENDQQKHEFENEKESLHQNISQLQSQNNKLEDDKNTLLDIKAKLQEEGKKHENDEILLTSKNDELQKQIKEIESSNAQNIEAMTLSFKTEKEKLLLETESLKSQIEKLKENEETNKKENESLRNQIAEIKSLSIPLDEVESIRKANIEITKRCSDLNNKIHELESQLNQNNDTVKLNEENNVDELLRIKVSELENQLQNVSNECAEKEDVILSLTSQVKEAKKTQKANDKVAADLLKANNDLRDQVTQMFKQIEELQLLTQSNHIFNLNDKQLVKDNEVTKIKTKSINIENESTNSYTINKFKEQIEQLNNQINSLKNENNDLQNQLSQSKSSNQEEITNESLIKPFKEQIEQLNSQINSLKNENNDLQNQLSQSKSLNQEEITNESLIKPFKKQNEQLSNKINSLQNENNELKNEVEQYKEKFEEYNELMKNIQEENQKLHEQLDLQGENQKHHEQLDLQEENEDFGNKSFDEQKDDIIANLVKIKKEMQDQVSRSFSIFEEEEEDQQEQETNDDQLKNKITKLTSEIVNLKDQNKKLQNQLNESIQNINDSNEAVIDSAKKSKYENLLTKQRKLIDSLRTQNEKLESSCVQATTNAENLASQNEKLKLKINESTLEYQELNKKYSQAIREYTNLQIKLNQNQEERSKDHHKNQRKILNDNLNENDDHLNKKISELQNQISLLKAENQQLKSSPTKALVAALQDEKADLEEKVYKLKEEINILKRDSNKQKEIVSNEDILSTFPISPIHQKTAKMVSKSSKRKSEEKEIIRKLMTENEILKRDNENQSHTITDLQLMLEMQSVNSDSQLFANNFRYPYSSVDNELKNLSVENQVLNSKLNEMKSIEIENKKLLNENMELKKLIRNRNSPSLIDLQENNARESPNLSDIKQRKALRVIGQLYLENKQQKLNL